MPQKLVDDPGDHPRQGAERQEDEGDADAQLCKDEQQKVVRTSSLIVTWTMLDATTSSSERRQFRAGLHGAAHDDRKIDCGETDFHA